MQLIKKLFGRPPTSAAGPESAQFHESEPTTEPGSSRNAPRRELVQVILRDCMRRHGIPSAWIDCRILSVVSRKSTSGMHVQLLVRDGVDRLLTYVPAFQSSFMDEISRFDPRVQDWLFSVSWQFENFTAATSTRMPDPGVWAGNTQPAALVSTPAQLPVKPPAAQAVRPPPVASSARPVPASPPVAPVQSGNSPAPQPAVEQAHDEEMRADLQALFAIRDAALGQQSSGHQDFEPTRPGTDDAPPPRRW